MIIIVNTTISHTNSYRPEPSPHFQCHRSSYTTTGADTQLVYCFYAHGVGFSNSIRVVALNSLIRALVCHLWLLSLCAVLTIWPNMKINCVDPKILSLMTTDFLFCNTEFPDNHRLRIIGFRIKSKQFFIHILYT